MRIRWPKKQQALFWSSFCSRWTPDLRYSPFCFVCDGKRSVRSGGRDVLVTTVLKKMQQPGSCGCEKVIITPVTLTPSEEVNPTLHYHRNTVGFLLPFSHLPFANPLLSAGWLQHAWKSSSKLFQAWAFPAPLLSFLSVFPSLGSCEDVRKVEDKTISSEINHSSLQFRGWCSGAVNTPPICWEGGR